jgi:hypothetical protein
VCSFCATFPGHLKQPRFDMHVDVFQAVIEGEFAPIQLPLDRAQPFHQPAASSSVMTPTVASILQWAMLPAMS